MKVYKIVEHQTDSDIGYEVLKSTNWVEIKAEFKNQFYKYITHYNCENDMLDGVVFDDAWKDKTFHYGTHNISVFEIKNRLMDQTVTFKIDPEVLKDLLKIGKRLERTQSYLIRKAIELFIKSQKQ